MRHPLRPGRGPLPRTSGVAKSPEPPESRPPSKLPPAPAPPIPVAPIPAGKKGNAAPPPPPCDTTVDALWQPGLHRIDGVTYWLLQVHTVDLNDDGRIDNVGFRLRPKEGDDLVLLWEGDSNRRSANAVPSLKVPDDGMVARLCFGRQTFEMPEAVFDEAVNKVPEEKLAFQLPNLQNELDAKTASPEAAGTEIEASPYGIWLVVASAIPFAAGFVALVVFLIRRRPSDDLDGDVADQEAV